MCSALQGRGRVGSRDGDLPSMFTEVWPKVAGGQMRMFGEGASVKCCGERGQAKPCGASSAEGRAKSC